MVIDSSAVIAIIIGEPGYQELEVAINGDTLRLISAASVLECEIVCSRRELPWPGRTVDRQLTRLGIYTVEVSLPQLAAAREAFRRFGKGNHPAGLNFGDFFSYALAKVSGEPLLFKGDDFSRTDITPA